MKIMALGIQKKIPDETLTRVLQELMITSLDVTSSSPTNNGVTIQVHGRLIFIEVHKDS